MVTHVVGYLGESPSLSYLTDTMTYTQLHENVDQWYDNINDVVEHAKPDSFGHDHYPRFNQYMYAYLSCISEFSDDIE